MSNPKVGAIVLAAGEASRFGAAKQVLVWQGKTLVERAVRACLDADCAHVIVVTGAHELEVKLSLKPILDSTSVSTTYNSDWAKGMHTSIVCGMQSLIQVMPRLDATIVMLADQPLIDETFLRKLIKAQTNADASALSYPSGAGVPACFGESLFQRLLGLSTTGGGAKAILRDTAVKTVLVNDLEKRRDIDTFADWNDFNQS